jgi:hypothetical protein
VAKRKKVNVDRARVYRSRGWSYDRIARNQDVSASAVYYALNPERRSAAPCPARTIYVPDAVWAVVVREAKSRVLSTSEFVAGILEERFGG